MDADIGCQLKKNSRSHIITMLSVILQQRSGLVI